MKAPLLRPKTQVFFMKDRARAFFCIEVKQGRKWTLLGNQEGIYRFDTAENRDRKMEEIRTLLASQSVEIETS